MSTQKNLWVHKIILANRKEVVVNWGTLVNTENSLCSQGNLCIDTTFFDWYKLCGVHKGFCVLTQGFLCKLVSWVLFSRESYFLDKNVTYRYYTMNLKTSNV